MVVISACKVGSLNIKDFIDLGWRSPRARSLHPLAMKDTACLPRHMNVINRKRCSARYYSPCFYTAAVLPGGYGCNWQEEQDSTAILFFKILCAEVLVVAPFVEEVVGPVRHEGLGADVG